MLKQHLFTTELFNDGSTPDESNCKIEWNKNIAEIGFIGDEQGLELYKIVFAPKLKYKKIKNKYD